MAGKLHRRSEEEDKVGSPPGHFSSWQLVQTQIFLRERLVLSRKAFFFIIPFTFGTFIDFLHSPKQGLVQGSHAASSSCTKSSPFHLGWTYTLLVSPVHPVCGLQGTQQAAHSPLPLPPTASHVLAHPSRFSSVIGNPTLFTVFFPRSFSVSLITFVIYSQAFPIFLIPQSPFIQLGTAKLQRLSSF